MTLIQYRRLRIPMATLCLVLAGAVWADRVHAQETVSLTFRANLQVTKMHPSVDGVGVSCSAPLPVSLPSLDGGTYLIYARSAPAPVVSHGFTGMVTATANVPLAVLAEPANRTLSFTCVLNMWVGGSFKEAAATAATPQNVIEGMTGNTELVATGSVATSTQTVTFPNVAAAP